MTTDQTGDNMITIQIGKGVRYRNVPLEVREKIFDDLTMENPKYKEAMKHGRWIGPDTPSHLYFFAVSSDKKIIWTPRGYLWYIKKWLNQEGYKIKIDDRTLRLPYLNIGFNGTLRDYQELAVNEMVTRYPQGILEAATGAGKTVMGCGIIARRKQPTLIIVHNKELLYQWQSSIKKFLNYDCGLIGDSKFDVKDISVGIINTVRNRTDQLVDKFGQIIIDEVHRCPSTTWTETLIQFPARFILGLSATPFRRDGLGKALNLYIGHKIHKVDKKVLHSTGAVLKPNICIVRTNFRYMYSDDYSKMISALCKDNERNELISRIVCKDFEQYKQNVLIVSDRVSHCREIANKLKNQGMDSRVLSGNVSSAKRIKIVEDVKAGRVNVLIATLSLVGEGFDAPNLCALFITTPVKFSGRLIQVVGRVLRPEKGKIPRVYDFRDDNVSILLNQGRSRSRIYTKEWGK